VSFLTQQYHYPNSTIHYLSFLSIYHAEDEPDRTSFWKTYRLDQSLLDLSVLALIRIVLGALALIACFVEGEVLPEFYPLELYHATSGTKKTRDELDEELLQQPCCSWWTPHVTRPAFGCELTCVITTLFCILKCLIRMNVQIGLDGGDNDTTTNDDNNDDHDDTGSGSSSGGEPIHPALWLAIAFGALCAVLESTFLAGTCDILSQWGQDRQLQKLQETAQQLRRGLDPADTPASGTPMESGDHSEDATTRGRTSVLAELTRPIRLLRQFSSTLSHVSSSLSVPLLSQQDSVDNNGEDAYDSDLNNLTLGGNSSDDNNEDLEDVARTSIVATTTTTTAPTDNNNNCSLAASTTTTEQPEPENIFGVSEIGAETDYKASWKDLISVCAPDIHLIGLAFVFLLLAAAAQVYIPRFTGKILDALAETFNHENTSHHRPNNIINDDYDQNLIIHNDDDGGINRHQSLSDVPGFLSNVRKLIFVSIFGGIFSGLRGSIFTVVRSHWISISMEQKKV
jgi:hypothetical protein